MTLRIKSAYVLGVLVVLCAPLGLFAQTHRARVCSQRFGGPCSAWDEQLEAPSLANPLTGSVHDHESGNGTCAFPTPNNVWLDASAQVDRPFDLVGTAQPDICAASGVDGDTRGTVEYFLDDGQFLFTRTDQPASPGETVSVRLRAEYMFIHEPTLVPVTPDIGNDWNQHFSLDMWFGGNGGSSPGVVQNVFMRENGEGSPIPPAESGGWVPVNNTGLLTVPLNTPVTFDVSMTVSMYDKYDTCASCQGIGRYESANTMRLRLAAQPFSFSGPGSYTVHAQPLLIYANYWPVVAVIDEDTTQEDLDELTTVDGNIIVDRAPDIGCLSFTNMTEVTGSIIVQGGPSYEICMELIEAFLSGNYYVAGHTGNVAATLGDVGGDVDIENSEGDVDLVVEGDVEGDVVIAEPGAAARDANAVAAGEDYALSVALNGASVGGRVSLMGVAPTTLSIPGPFSIGDDLEANNLVQSTVDLSQVSVGGNIMLRTRDAASIDISTAAQDTRVVSDHTTDALDLTVPTGAIATGSPLSIDRLGGAELPWQAGVKPNGGSAALDPLAMFAVEVGAGSLAQPATLAMELNLTDLLPPQRAALNQVVSDGRLTVARRSTGGPLQSFPLCPTDEPSLGCAALRALDGAGLPTTIELASSVRLSTLTSDFSDWALVVVSNGEEIPAMSEWGLAVFGLLVLTAGTVFHRRAMRTRPGGSILASRP